MAVRIWATEHPPDRVALGKFDPIGTSGVGRPVTPVTFCGSAERDADESGHPGQHHAGLFYAAASRSISRFGAVQDR